MSKENNIQKELSKIAPSVMGKGVGDSYKIPQDYFKELESKVLDRLKSKEYRTPPEYFTDLEFRGLTPKPNAQKNIFKILVPVLSVAASILLLMFFGSENINQSDDWQSDDMIELFADEFSLEDLMDDNDDQSEGFLAYIDNESIDKYVEENIELLEEEEFLNLIQYEEE